MQYIHPAYLFSPISAVFVPLCPAVSAVYTIILHDYRKVFNGYKIKARLGSVLGISVGVRLVEPKTIARSEGKAKRVEDRRNLH